MHVDLDKNTGNSFHNIQNIVCMYANNVYTNSGSVLKFYDKSISHYKYFYTMDPDIHV